MRTRTLDWPALAEPTEWDKAGLTKEEYDWQLRMVLGRCRFHDLIRRTMYGKNELVCLRCGHVIEEAKTR